MEAINDNDFVLPPLSGLPLDSDKFCQFFPLKEPQEKAIQALVILDERFNFYGSPPWLTTFDIELKRQAWLELCNCIVEWHRKQINNSRT